MPWSLDARIPVLTLVDPAALAVTLAGGPPTAVLAVSDVAPSAGAVGHAALAGAAPHTPACTCCAGRGPAALALDRLFQDRVRGRCGWFERVVALVPDAAAREQVAAALRDDALTAARYRPA